MTTSTAPQIFDLEVPAELEKAREILEKLLAGRQVSLHVGRTDREAYNFTVTAVALEASAAIRLSHNELFETLLVFGLLTVTPDKLSWHHALLPDEVHTLDIIPAA